MKILGIDFSAMFRRNWEASGGRELSQAYERTLQTVASIRDGYDRVAILCDSGSSFRKALLPTYKANRERPPAPFYEQQERTIRRLEKDGCSIFVAPVVGEDNGQAYCCEADDLAWALAQWCIANRHALTIYGGDKDLLQCVDDAACIYVVRPDHDGIWTASRVVEKFGVGPNLIADLLALGGDTSDGFKMFPGWTDEKGDHPGIGQKNAAALLQRFGNILGVVDAIEGKDPATDTPLMKDGAIKEALRRGQPTPLAAAQLGLSVATLRLAPELVDFSPLDAQPVWAPLTRTDAGAAVAPPIVSEDGDRHAIPSPPPPPRDTVADCRATRATVESAPEIEAEPVLRTAHATSHSLARVEVHMGEIDRLAFQPRNVDELMKWANRLYESRFYGQYPTPESIAVVIMEANERGLPMGVALRNAYVVKGKPAWSTVLLASLVMSSGKADLFEIVETTTERAVLAYQRKGRPAREFEFTIEEARNAGWIKPDGKWALNPRLMLRYAAMREGARAFFYDVVAGMPAIEDFPEEDRS